MVFALDMMNCKTNTQNRYKNSYLYSKNLEESIILRSGENHWSAKNPKIYTSGNNVSVKPKKKVRMKYNIKKSKVGLSNPFYGKHHKEDTIEGIREKTTGINNHRVFIIKIFDENDNIQFCFYSNLLESISKVLDLPKRSLITSYRQNGRRIFQHKKPNKPNGSWIKYKNWYAIKEYR